MHSNLGDYQHKIITYTWVVIYHMHACILSCFSRVWLCDPIDCSPPGSSVHGILQARILKWITMPSSRGIFPTQRWKLCLLHLLYWQAGSLPLVPSGKHGNHNQKSRIDRHKKRRKKSKHNTEDYSHHTKREECKTRR